MVCPVAHHNTRAEIYGIVPVEECLRHARLNESQGVKRFSLVTSGRRPTEKETEVLCEHFAKLHRQCGISLCASLGLATADQLKRLKEAGVTRYHCNLETAPSYFGHLCSTHTQAQKIETLKAAREAGMDICSGGIIGMGETPAQRVELAFASRNWKFSPFRLILLHPIPGTPLEHAVPLTSEEIIALLPCSVLFILMHTCALQEDVHKWTKELSRWHFMWESIRPS